mmetsp:Transcript_105685/g.298935  ORF Transcript_105685/g.298935 Transcript_105685/m.298935 type:complete len:204 (-) Transcript_105685:1511-2122(-)
MWQPVACTVHRLQQRLRRCQHRQHPWQTRTRRPGTPSPTTTGTGSRAPRRCRRRGRARPRTPSADSRAPRATPVGTAMRLMHSAALTPWWGRPRRRRKRPTPSPASRPWTRSRPRPATTSSPSVRWMSSTQSRRSGRRSSKVLQPRPCKPPSATRAAAARVTSWGSAVEAPPPQHRVPPMRRSWSWGLTCTSTPRRSTTTGRR